MKIKKVISLALVLGIMGSLSGCSSKSTDTGKGNLEKVTVILDYVPNTNHTGIYAAKEKGYYEEAGLDVEIIEPAEGATVNLVAVGKGDFGIAYQEDVTYAKASEDPLPIKAVAAIIQHNTSGFASYKDKNITSPKDFEGKTYTGWGSPSEEAVIKAVMTKYGADPSKINIITSSESGNYAALENKVDLMWIYKGWDGISMDMAGISYNYLELKDLDSRLDYYTPVIIANDEVINNKKDMTQKFVSATAKGYEFAEKNSDESAEILHKYAPDYDIEMLKKSQEYLSSKYSEGTETWGLMKEEVWDNYTDFMKENNLINKDVKSSDCYTNEFLQ